MLILRSIYIDYLFKIFVTKEFMFLNLKPTKNRLNYGAH